MLFNSYIFILCFLPLTLIGYFLINRTTKYQIANLFLIGMSLWFYGYYNPVYLIVIICSILVNYILSRGIILNDGKLTGKWLLTIGVAANAISIFYFKYFDFFLENTNRVFNTSFELKHIVLPLGISFFTFQQISYLVDSYKGQTREYGFIEYALFVVYFPQLIAGPIVLHRETIPQFRDEERRRFKFSSLNKGLYFFSIGLFKKVLIADTLSKAVAWGFGYFRTLTSMEAIIISVCYTMQLYFDFSGYCDMATGMASMFNIELPQNFNSPYKANSIVDFWSRWHMSLTRFLREYVYFPLGGSKKGKVRTYINIMIVFLVSGIWHGANWTFILWGILHGLLNCLTRATKNVWSKMNIVFQWFLTFSMVNILWIIFRADNILQAKIIIANLIKLEDFSISKDLVACFRIPELVYMERFRLTQFVMDWVGNLWMWLFIGGAFIIVLNLKNIYELKFKNSVKQAIITIIFMTWSIMSLAGVSEFLYFGF